jgi:hypothetical protein
MGKISTAGVLRLRATSAVSRDKSARRSAQDDDFGVSTKNILNKLALMGRSPHNRFLSGWQRKRFLYTQVRTSNLVRAFETIHFPPRYPGFPVEVSGVDKLHAAFLNESLLIKPPMRPWMGLHSRKSGVLRAFCEGWDPRISIQTFAYPTLCKERKGWGTGDSWRFLPGQT